MAVGDFGRIWELSVVALGPSSVVGGASGKLGLLIMKNIIYLCFASFVKTTYTMAV